jgi:oxygen-independent coproporphyrinogen-3 oxidase
MEKEPFTLADGCCDRPAEAPPAAHLAGIYIHVPFCRAKCPYCDFYSIADDSRIPDYLDGLCAELSRCRHAGQPADSIYFGGGTPSLLTADAVGRILDAVGRRFVLSGDAELTLEVNPGTVSRISLAAYRSLGINRINIGLQAFDDPTLAFLGRIHTAGQGRDAFDWARAAGFDNVGLDLIYAVPGQTRRQWQAQMAQAVHLSPEHLACYSLTVEPDTPLAHRVADGGVRLPSEKMSADLFDLTAAYLNANGYRQYEISNFAKPTAAGPPDRRSRHNRKYWSAAPYLGFGPAAHSFIDPARWWNHRFLDRYLADLAAGKAPIAQREVLTRTQRLTEFVYLGLRQTAGIDKANFESRFAEGFDARFEPQLTRLADEGLIENAGTRIRLTGRGRRFLEGVVVSLLD